jgi:PAS domain S-box-containing protein
VRRKLDLPDAMFDTAALYFADFALHLARRGYYGDGEPEALAAAHAEAALRAPVRSERRLPDGRIVEEHGATTPGGFLITTYADVTAARQAMAELQVSRERLARALDASEIGLWEYDVASRHVYLSGRWAQMLGLPAQDQVCNLDVLTGMVPAEDLPGMRESQLDLLRGRKTRLAEEHRMLAVGGVTIWLLTEAQVTERDPDGRVRKVVGASKNITHRRHSEEAVRQALAAAADASRAKGEFLATMSHEIRTPINGVIGLAQLLRDTRLPKRQSRYVSMIYSCAKSLLGLVDNVLDFSKIEAGRLTLVDSQADLRVLVREVADVVSWRAAEKDLAFNVEVSPTAPACVLVDIVRLKQVLLNLLGNACKFTHAGSVSLRVDVVEAGADARLRFVVADTGIGIGPADQARLFTRFTQADGSARRRYDGTGLGLAISRELARLMGGDVDLVSRPGMGSTFTLEIPLRVGHPEPEPEHDAPRSRSSASILLVEDNDVNRVVAQGLLAALGYSRVDTAEHGLEGLAACERKAYDLILMDCQMPEMDGLRATMEIRKRGWRMPIIALTAHAMSGDRERCLMAGMDDYLTKPIEPKLLGDMLSHWLESAGSEQEAGCEAPQAGDVYDARALQDRFLGNVPLFQQARRMFLDRAPDTLRGIVYAALQRDARRVVESSHQLKGSAATVGAARLAALCARAEKAGLDPDAAHAWLDTAQAELIAYERASTAHAVKQVQALPRRAET